MSYAHKNRLLAACMLACAGPAVAAPLSFTGIGTLPGGATSRATSISPDGTRVGAVSLGMGGDPEAFIFPSAGGMPLAIGSGADSVLALSALGARAVGVAGTRGYLFTLPSGPFLQPYDVASSIAGISADGLVTAGYVDGIGAFRRAEGQDLFQLEVLSGYSDMIVSGCSADGNTVVGTAVRVQPGEPFTGDPDLIFYEAARFDGETLWTGLGFLDNTLSPTESYANAVSADGSTVVGTSLVSRAIPDSTDVVSIYTAFKHQSGAMTPLLSQAGELGFSEALDATADGAIVVGSGDGGSSETGSSATIWFGSAPQDVKDMLIAALTAANRSTAALDNWSLTSCTAISDDGAWLAGEGLFMGVAQGWVARRLEEPNFTQDVGATVGTSLGGTAVFFVEAAGTPAPTLQWFTGTPGSGTPLSDGGSISGATTGTLLVSNVQLADAGTTYYCVATSSLGTATSTVATLVVNSPPMFTLGLPPTSSAVAGSDFSLTVAASGIPDPAFQWFTGTPGSGTPLSDSPGSVSGATTPTLTLINIQPGAAGDYFCTATNVVATATSNVTTLSIVVPPTITMHPQAKAIVRAGDGVGFLISASGSPAPMFQWSKGTPGFGTNLMDDGTTINGATTPFLQLLGVTPDTAGLYYCTAFIDGGFFANSTAVNLIVNTGPVITQQPQSTDVDMGDTATFTVAIDATALGTDSVTYEWQRDGTPIDLMADPRFTVDNTSGNFATSTLTITNVAEADLGLYSVLITGPSGTTQSEDATLGLDASEPVQITMHPVPFQRKGIGETATFTVAATGNPPPFYAWIRRTAQDGDQGLVDGPTPWGSVISGANTATLTITNIGERIRPNAPTREINQLPGLPTVGSPRGFVMLDLSDMVPGPDTLYVLDDGADPASDAGLYKYAYDGSISQWVETGYAPLPFSQPRGLSARVVPEDTLGTGSPSLVILLMTGNDGDILLFAIDQPAYGSGLGSFMVADGMPAPPGTKYRGTAVVSVPLAPPPGLALIASRVGDGTTPLSNTGSPVTLDVLFLSDTPIALPVKSTGPGINLILDGASPDEGQLTVSPDGRFIALAGYNAELGGPDPLFTTNSATVPRSVMVFDTLTGQNLSTALADFADQGRPAAAVTDDGVNLWVVGSSGGLRYTTIGSDTSVPLTAASPTDLRTVAIFGNQLHVAAAADLPPPPDPVSERAASVTHIRIGSVPPAPPLGSDFAEYYCEVFNFVGPGQTSETSVLEDAATPLILQGPQDATVPTGTAASFTVTLDPSENGAAVTYTWFRDGTPVDFGTDTRISVNPVSGTGATSTLTIDPVMASDAGFFEVQVRRSAGGNRTAHAGAALTVSDSDPRCRIDFNGDTVVNPDDIGDFVTAYFDSPPRPGPGGYAIPCPGNDPPYDQGYQAGFTLDGAGQCNEPFPDNIGDWITAYFEIDLAEPFSCSTL